MKSRNYNFYIVGLMWVVLFIPQFQSYVGLAIEQGLAILSTCISVILLCSVYKLNIKRIHIFVILFYLVIIGISIIRGSFNRFDPKDIFEISKPLYLGSYFILSYSIDWDESLVKKFFLSLCFCLGVMCIFGYFESLTSIGNTIGHVLYKDMRGGVQFKAVGSFISPYVFATVLMIPLFFFMSKFFTNKRPVDFFIFLFFLFGILLTQSRTIFLSLIISLLIITVYLFSTNNYLGKKLLINSIVLFIVTSVIFIAALAEVIADNFPYLYQGLDLLYVQLMDFDFISLIYSTPSIYHRYEQFQFAISNTDEIPLIGAGIGKALFMPESFYALYLYRTGVLGIFIHLLMLAYIFHRAHKLAGLYKDDWILNSIFISVVFYIISLPFSYASSALTDQVRSGFLFYVIAGMVFKMYDMEMKNEQDFYWNSYLSKNR